MESISPHVFKKEISNLSLFYENFIFLLFVSLEMKHFQITTALEML